MTKKRKGKPVTYRVKNWSTYTSALKQRGAMVFMIATDLKDRWLVKEPESRPPGGQDVFTNFAIEVFLQIRELVKLPLRQTEGFINGLFELGKIDLPVPDYTLVSKRSKDLGITLRRFHKGESPDIEKGKCIAIDSTGFKTCGEGEWLKEKHNANTRKQWRKVHIAGDLKSKYIVGCTLTTNKVTDADEVSALLNQVHGNVDKFLGDGAYDMTKVHNELEGRYPGINIVTLPRIDASLSGSSARAPTQRDKHLLKIEEKGRDAWQAISGYNDRNFIENTMFRIKTTFGGKLRAKKIENQKVENRIKCELLNIMTSLGMPESVKVRHR